MSWYKQLMPTIKEAKSYVKSYVEDSDTLPGLKDVYAHGYFAKNINKNNEKIKRAEIIFDSDYYSEDLISISQKDEFTGQPPFKMSRESLEDYGYNPDAVNFTKHAIKMENNNQDFDIWCISSDDKILHWGAVPEDPEELEEIKSESESIAEHVTGITRDNLEKASSTERNEWLKAYDQHFNQYTNNMPKGWYITNHDKDELLQESKKIK